MQMVAASKMRKAQQAAIDVRPFVRLIYRIQRHGDDARDRLHASAARGARGARRRAVILVAADKGLCGALNSNLFRLAGRYDPQSTVFITAGRKASQFVARTRRQLVAEFPYGDTPRFAESRAIAALARDLFLKGDVDEVEVIATRFVNTLDAAAGDARAPAGRRHHGLRMPGADADGGDLAADITEFLFEPSAGDLIGYLLGHYLNIFIHLVLLNAKASEQSARMVSMKNATDNADEMIKDLTLEYNKLRQGRITQELLEIAGGQAG